MNASECASAPSSRNHNRISHHSRTHTHIVPGNTKNALSGIREYVIFPRMRGNGNNKNGMEMNGIDVRLSWVVAEPNPIHTKNNLRAFNVWGKACDRTSAAFALNLFIRGLQFRLCARVLCPVRGDMTKLSFYMRCWTSMFSFLGFGKHDGSNSVWFGNNNKNLPKISKIRIKWYAFSSAREQRRTQSLSSARFSHSNFEVKNSSSRPACDIDFVLSFTT